MLIAKVQDDVVLYVADYRDELKHVSFPSTGMTDEALRDLGYLKVNLFKEHDKDLEKLVPCPPYVEDGWAYTVRIEPLTEEDLLQKNASLANEIRYRRSLLLQDTVDKLNPLRWETFTEENKHQWREYRQALLDIPEQPGFPKEVVWPEQP